MAAADRFSNKPASQSLRPASSGPVDHFVATVPPESAVGRQLRWVIAASSRLPLSEADLRAHFSQAFLAAVSVAQINSTLSTFAYTQGLRLLGLSAVAPDVLVAIVRGRGGQRLVLLISVDRAGQINGATIGPQVTLPRPTGPSAVGSDHVDLVDAARANRRLSLTRWYPAAGASLERPLAAYASPSLAIAIGVPALSAVQVNARTGSSSRPGSLPVVLFSPGFGTTRVLYQALAEDLASHGYLVVAVDHTGEAPVEFADGHITLPSPAGSRRITPTVRATRLADMRFVLHHLNTLRGPRSDLRRVAAVGHSLGGSTAAALMLAEPAVRAGVDLDGDIFDTAAQRGVPRAFMVLAAGKGLLARRNVQGLLNHSRGPRLALEIAGLQHFSFSDLPVIDPRAPDLGKTPSARDIAVERVYVRAFLDRYLSGQRSALLEGPSARWPQVRFAYRHA